LGFAPKPIDGAIRTAIQWFVENGYTSPRAGST